MTENFKALLADFSLQIHPLATEQPELFLCPLTDLGIISLVGEQSKDYLQGQLTNDLNKLTNNNYVKTSHCDAKGKAWSVMDLFKIEDTFLLSGHLDELEASRAQLQKYGVFSKTTISDASDTWFSFGLGGPNAAQWLVDNWQVSFEGETCAKDIPHGKVLKLCDKSFLVVTDEPSALLNTFKDVLYHHQLWDYWNIIAGKAYLTAATTGQHVPQTLNLQSLDAISFTKGCYTGQEMVARMKYLGKNKRATYILQGKASNLPEDGHEVQLAIGDNWRRSGTVVNFAGEPDQLFLLAILPNDLSPDALLRLKDDEDSALTIQPLPYDLNAD